MATQGSTTDLGFRQNIEAKIAAKRFSVPACTMVRISAYLVDDPTSSVHGVCGVIYDTSGNRIAQTSARTDISNAGAAYDFATTQVLSAGTYDFGVCSNLAGGELQISNGFGTPDYLDEGIDIGTSPDGPNPPASGVTLEAGFQDWAIAIEYTEGGGSSFSLTVDSASAAGQGQTITTPGLLTVEHSQAAANPYDVALLFDAAYVIPVVSAPAAMEGQQIPFIYSQPGTEGSAAAQGSDISLLAQALIVVDYAGGAGQGQDVTLIAVNSVVVDPGQAAMFSYEVQLTATGLPSTGDGVIYLRRRRRK